MNRHTRSLMLTGAIFALSFTPLISQAAEAKPKISIGADIGFRIPNGAVKISVGKDNVYYHKGTYYKKKNNGYHVVRPPRGTTIRHLPRGYSRRVVSGTIYYHFDGVYYRKMPTGYVVVNAPTVVEKEVVVEKPNSSYETLWIGDDKYLYKEGQFFRETPDGLAWVEAPIGATINQLPQDATSIWHNDIEYHESDDNIYRKTPNGYKIVEKPWEVAEDELTQ